MTAVQLRDQALLMLEGKGAILDVARNVSRVLEQSNNPGAIIGGVAVVLHGHVRTTVDVDVYIPDKAEEFASRLRAAGFDFDSAQREFRYAGVPVHLVTRKQAPIAPSRFEQIEDVRVVSLADLLNLKLHSGTRSIARAQDLADVIGLIRCRGLTGEFARHIQKPLRNEFRKLVRAVKKEMS
jgi:hypothetical protein